MTVKERVRIFLPVFKEIEAMGLNPIKTILFGKGGIENAEICYIAITKAKAKYPKWYKEVSSYINRIMGIA